MLCALMVSRHRRKVFEHADDKVQHGLLLEDFANAILHGKFTGVDAEDSLGESLTAMAIYRSNDSGQMEPVFVSEYLESAGETVQSLVSRL
eukprot:COSAG02_NODE_7668_length_2903_cov_2.612340_4_plen_91_part_00